MRLRMSPTRACGLACALGLTAAARGADETGKWYVYQQYGYTWVDSDRSVDDDYHFALGGGKHLGERWSVELNALTANFDRPGLELDQTAYSFDALRVFARADRFSPYLTFGAGYIENDFTSDDLSGPLAELGAGLLIDIAENRERTFAFQLRPEVKLRYDWADTPQQSTFHDTLFGLSFLFSFGSARSAPPPAAQPLPPPAPPAEPADSDGDGVLDPDDRCPNTPPGVAVDALGCPRTETVTFRRVGFAFASAALTPAARSILDEVAAALKRYPQMKVELQGHSDSVGPESYNVGLSQRRAHSVRDYLISQGASAGQLAVTGYGERRPIADNRTGDGRAANRRVVMAVLSKPSNVEVQGAEN